MERKRLRMEEVVGLNVKARRSRRDWSQGRLREALEEQGVRLSRATIAQLESGTRPVSVSELLALGLALGVAPHVLLYPPSGADIERPNGEVLYGPHLSDWLLAPDNHDLTGAGEIERNAWLDGVRDRLTEEQWEGLSQPPRRRYLPDLDEEQQVTEDERSGG
jgi:transcriptional regulator with XRE-family HTH domain